MPSPTHRKITPTPDEPPPGALIQKVKGIAGELAPLREQPNVWFKVRVWNRPTYEAVKNAADTFISNVRNGKYKDVPADAFEPAMAIEEPNEGTSAYEATVWLRYVGT